MRLSLFLDLFLFCIIGNAFSVDEYYVQKDKSGEACDADHPCPSLNFACDKTKAYDIVNIIGDFGPLDETLIIDNSVTIKSSSDGVQINFSLKNVNPGQDFRENEVYGVFYIINSAECIIKDFKFSIAQFLETPECPIFCLKGNYLRIDNCQFVRTQLNLTAEEKDVNLTSVLIFSENDGAINLLNCVFESFNSSTGFIEAKSVACYNCAFKNLGMERSSVIKSAGSYMDILDCTFENCVSDEVNGSAINASPSERLIIGGYKNVTKFSGCKANGSDFVNSNDERGYGFGGAIYLTFNFIAVNMSGVTFDKNNKNLAQTKGNCMFIEGDYLKYIWNKKTVPFMKDVSSSSEDFLYHYKDDWFYKIYSLKKLYNGEDNDGSSKLYVADGGSDSNDCSSSDNACYTIKHASSLVRYHDVNIIFSANYTLREADSGKSYNYKAKSIRKNEEPYNPDYPDYPDYPENPGGSSEEGGGGSSSSGEVAISTELIGYLGGSRDFSSVNDDVWIIVNGGSLNVRGVEINIKGLNFVVEKLGECVLDCYSPVVNLDSLTFLPRDAKVETKECYISSRSFELYMSDCSFKNLRGGDGAVQISSGKVKISDCSFEYCENDGGYGGGLYIEIDSEYVFCGEEDRTPELCSVEGCTFIGCAAERGGAIYLDLEDEPRQVSVKDCKFDNNSLTDIYGRGYDLCVRSPYIYLIASINNFPTLKGVKEDSECAYGIWVDEEEDEYFFNLVNYINEYKRIDNYYVSDSGDDNNTCKDKDNACWTLNHYVEDYSSAYHSVNIYIVGNYTLDEVSLKWSEFTFTQVDSSSNLEIGSNSLYVNNKTTFKNLLITFVSNGGYTCFYCSGSLIQFINVTFKPEDSSIVIDKHIVETNYDLLIDKCVFDSVRHSEDFISTTTRYNNINIKGCTFKNCATDDEGGGLSLYDKTSLDVSNTFRVSDCSFDGCVATFGGALYVSLSRYTSLVVSGITFGSSNNILVGGRGKNIYVSADVYNYIDYKKVFPNLNKATDGDNLYSLNYNDEDDGMIGFSLIDVLNNKNRTGEKMYYIGDSGQSVDDCTGPGNDKLCPLFYCLYDKVRFDVCNVTIVGNYSRGLSTGGVYIYNIVGNTDSNIIVSSSGDSKDSEDYKLSFSLDSTISNLSVTIDKTLRSNAISVYSGIVTINSVAFKAGVDDLVVRNSILSVKGDGHLIVNKCTFIDIAGEEKGRAIYGSFEEFGSLEISGTEFNNLTTTKVKGGAIYCELGTNSTFIVQGSGSKKTIFKECGKNCDLYHYHIIWAEEGGDDVCSESQGGAVYLVVNIDAKKILMTNIEFGKGEEKNRGVCGYNVLIDGDYLDRIVNNKNFKFLSKSSTEYNGVYYHGSVGSCGLDMYASNIDALKDAVLSRGGSSDDDGFPWWGVLIIVLVIIIIIVVVVIVIVICVCKRKGSGGGEGGGESKSNEGGEEKEASKEGEGEKA